MKEAPIYNKLIQERVQCLICPRFCILDPKGRGFCGLYINVNGVLNLESYGAVIAAFPSIHGNIFFHPDKQLLQVNLPGCNSGCEFCWYAPYVGKPVMPMTNYAGNRPFAVVGSSAPFSGGSVLPRTCRFVPPSQLIEIMTHTYNVPYGIPLNPHRCHGLNFTVVEPAVNLSYVLEASKLCHEADGVNLLCTSGALSPQTVELLSEYVDSVRVSFKSNGDADFYRLNCRGIQAKSAFDCAKFFKEKGVFVQILNTFAVNDPIDKFRKWARWVVENLGSETPVVAGAMMPFPSNSTEYFTEIEQAAKETGIMFFFLDDNKTPFSMKCPKCQTTLIYNTPEFSTTYHLNMNIYETKEFALPVAMDKSELNVDEKGRCLTCGFQTPIIT